MNHKQANNSAWLFKLAVDKDYWNKGIGKALVHTVQNYCRSKGYLDLHLAVSECQEHAKHLFTNCGCVLIYVFAF